jgi:lipopolysaccharide/colanic/teichoic acid biosynthesis glycosyltransferase
MRAARLVKRLIDIVAALVLLILSGPVMIWAICAIRRDSPGPAVFRQTRIGLGGRRFQIYKLRTMRDGAQAEWKAPLAEDFDSYVFQVPDDPRITRIGAYLRRTSIDELPQLLNVLKGDMSLIGPRPEIPEMVALYKASMHRRHQVKPGITGLAQVSGRGSLTTGEIMVYDLRYSDKWSLRLDCWILKETVRQVFAGQEAR